MAEFDTYTLWDFLNQDGGRRNSPPSDTNYVTDNNDDALVDSNGDHIIYEV